MIRISGLIFVLQPVTAFYAGAKPGSNAPGVISDRDRPSLVLDGRFVGRDDWGPRSWGPAFAIRHQPLEGE